jgi:flagellar motility protein MotE (MotC chaperone)
MIQTPLRDTRSNSIARIGAQPIALAAATLLVVVLGIASIALWRAYTGASPELDRVAAARQLQARTAQASEQLVEKAKGLEETQQESIDQLQVVQDQLLTVRRLLAAQQADTRRLSEQVSGLKEAVEGLRQSFASTQATDAPVVVRNKPIRTRSQAAARHRHARSRS